MCRLLAALLLAQVASSPKLDQELLRSAERGDAATVRVLLRRGASANAARSDGDTLTALMLASRGGHVPVIRLLLPAGAKVNAAASVAVGSSGVNEGVTALMLAAQSGNVAAVKALLDAGADPNARAVFKTGEDLHEAGFRTVAMHAASGSVLQLLGERGADLTVKDSKGNGLLHYSPDAAAAMYLLKNGADPKARNSQGETALDWATRDGRADVVKALESSAGHR